MRQIFVWKRFECVLDSVSILVLHKGANRWMEFSGCFLSSALSALLSLLSGKDGNSNGWCSNSLIVDYDRKDDKQEKNKEQYSPPRQFR